MWDIITKSEKDAAEKLSSEQVRRTHHNNRDGFQIFVPLHMLWYSEACFPSDHHSNLSFSTKSFAELHLT